MPQFCDVAVPVPLDATFTYRLPEDAPEPCIGGRVIVPFREKRLCGIVTELHDREPKFQTRRLSQVLDSTPALTPELMQLGRWIAQYYIAPIGEVFRTMLPLSAEFRRAVGDRSVPRRAASHAAKEVDCPRRPQRRARCQPHGADRDIEERRGQTQRQPAEDRYLPAQPGRSARHGGSSTRTNRPAHHVANAGAP